MDILNVLPMFGNTAWALVAFIVALSIIVAIHEYGHYIVGRWTGIHAEVFSLGFGPVMYSRTDKRGTVWQLAAIPLGGYVKFLGDANAASVGGTKGGRNTMLGAPIWARALTVAAGPVFNFALSVILFAIVLMVSGTASDPLTLKSVPALPPHYEMELQAGDEMVAVNGAPISSAADLGRVVDSLPVQPALDYTIRRDGVERMVRGPYPSTTMILSVSKGSAAAETDLAEGDVITAIDAEPVFAFDQMVRVVNASDGRELTLTVWRDGTSREVILTPRRMDLPKADASFETRWIMGVNGGVFVDPETRTPGPGAALWNAVEQVWYMIRVTMSAIYSMATGQISLCNLSGPVGMAQVAGDAARAGIMDFVAVVAVISTAIGFLNLLPIPVLDGGHLVFHAYEAVARRPPNDAVVRVLMVAGLTIILAMMIVGLANDIMLCRGLAL